jgi:hypothetical protein
MKSRQDLTMASKYRSLSLDISSLAYTLFKLNSNQKKQEEIWLSLAA